MYDVFIIFKIPLKTTTIINSIGTEMYSLIMKKKQEIVWFYEKLLIIMYKSYRHIDIFYKYLWKEYVGMSLISNSNVFFIL